MRSIAFHGLQPEGCSSSGQRDITLQGGTNLEAGMSPLRTVLTGSVRYRGREGQLAFILHRLSGLGTLLFLGLHILDTSTVYFFPNLYKDALALYRNPLFMVGEIFLVAAVIYHGVNGLRIALFDLFPHLWRPDREKPSVYTTLAVTLVLWLPAAFIMGRSLIGFTFLGWE